MDALRNLFGGGNPQQEQQNAARENTSLLADWQSYSATSDVEAGAAGAAAGAREQLTKAAEDVGSSISSFFRSGYTTVSDGITNIQSTTLETS